MDLDTIQAYISRGYVLSVRFRTNERKYHATVDLGTVSTSFNFMAASAKESLEGLERYLQSLEESSDSATGNTDA